MTTERATVAATQDTAALEYQEHLRRLVDTFPPLTEAQRALLAALLRSAVHRARKAARPT